MPTFHYPQPFRQQDNLSYPAGLANCGAWGLQGNNPGQYQSWSFFPPVSAPNFQVAGGIEGFIFCVRQGLDNGWPIKWSCWTQAQVDAIFAYDGKGSPVSDILGLLMQNGRYPTGYQQVPTGTGQNPPIGPGVPASGAGSTTSAPAGALTTVTLPNGQTVVQQITPNPDGTYAVTQRVADLLPILGGAPPEPVSPFDAYPLPADELGFVNDWAAQSVPTPPSGGGFGAVLGDDANAAYLDALANPGSAGLTVEEAAYREALMNPSNAGLTPEGAATRQAALYESAGQTPGVNAPLTTTSSAVSKLPAPINKAWAWYKSQAPVVKYGAPLVLAGLLYAVARSGHRA